MHLLIGDKTDVSTLTTILQIDMQPWLIFLW